jgi:hypothetical protein
MERDVSKTTLAILLVLTILVAVIGTWSVLDASMKTRAKLHPNSETSQVQDERGEASFKLKVRSYSDVAGGQIKLNVVPPQQ